MLGHKLDPILGIDVVTRLGEKKVLWEIQNSFEEYIVDIDHCEHYQETRLKKLGLMGEQGDIIFWGQNHPCSHIKFPIEN